MNLRRWCTLGLVSAAALGLARPSSAAPDEVSTRRADELFREGQRLFDAGKIQEACARFAESRRLDPTLGALLNLANCHEAEGKTASAHAEFDEAAKLAAQRGPAEREREGLARDHLLALEKKTSYVALEIGPGAALAEIKVDGQALDRAAWAAPIPLDPGDHAITFAAPGKKTLSKTVKIAEPGTQKLAVPALEDESSGLPPPPPPPPDDGRGRRIAGFVAGGVGLVGIGVGSYFGIRAASKQSAAQGHCAGRFCDPEGLSLDRDAHGSATVSTVLFGVGIAGLAAGAVLVLTSLPKSQGQAAILRVRPLVGASGGGLHIDAAW